MTTGVHTIFDVTDEIATLTLNRPEAKNALSNEMRVELDAALEECTARAGDDINWLIVYVLLSRARSLANLRSIGITSQIRKIIEAGPPSMFAENFERLFRSKITNTKAAAVAAKSALGWQ